MATRPTASVPNSSPLLLLPRELRDVIYGFVAEAERLPVRMKKTADAFDSALLVSDSGLILACRQLHTEYQDVHVKRSMQRIRQQGPPAHVVATVYNVKFNNIIQFLSRLSGTDRQMFSQDIRIRQVTFKVDYTALNFGNWFLHIKLVFTAAQETKRSNLLNWVDFCNRTGVKANYTVPDFAQTKSGECQGRGPRAYYVNIYDLFAEESDPDSEEEVIFHRLQRWHAWRSVKLPARCGTGKSKALRKEAEEARSNGWRSPKTPVACERPVREAS